MPRDLNKVFEQIYRKEVWGKGKGSGTGSSPEYCRDYLTYLNSAIFNGARVMDIGCGDHQLWAEFDLKKWRYIGVDASEQALEMAANRYEQPPPLFLAHTPAEIEGIAFNFEPHFILLKDVMMHWTDEEIDQFLDMLVKVAPTATIIASHNYKYFRKPSMNYEPRKLDRYSWAPIPEDHPAMVRHGFRGIRYYPRGKYKLISVRTPNA
jgi:2-polyprenyl-3-methyl-5-hydroxy-6-metoxy-1,4-benzoquinol methylase